MVFLYDSRSFVGWIPVMGLKVNDCDHDHDNDNETAAVGLREDTAGSHTAKQKTHAQTQHTICGGNDRQSAPAPAAESLAACERACAEAGSACSTVQWQEGKNNTTPLPSVNQCFLYKSCASTKQYTPPADGRDWCFHILQKNYTQNASANAFDSHTIYTAWSGQQAPLLSPLDKSQTMFYYAGGNGPHTGQRDDSIGLARATTHAYAGLRAKVETKLKTETESEILIEEEVSAGAEATSRIITAPLDISNDTTAIWLLAAVTVGKGGRVKVSAVPSTGVSVGEVTLEPLVPPLALTGMEANGSNTLSSSPSLSPVWWAVPSVVLDRMKRALQAEGLDANATNATRLLVDARPPVVLYAVRVV